MSQTSVLVSPLLRPNKFWLYVQHWKLSFESSQTTCVTLLKCHEFIICVILLDISCVDASSLSSRYPSIVNKVRNKCQPWVAWGPSVTTMLHSVPLCFWKPVISRAEGMEGEEGGFQEKGSAHRAEITGNVLKKMGVLGKLTMPCQAARFCC